MGGDAALAHDLDPIVEDDASSIFGKLGLTTSEGVHRRVLAVLAFLRSG